MKIAIMANHKSAVKSHKKSLIKKERNSSILNQIKTFIKKLEELVKAGSEEAPKVARKAESAIMKGVSKGVLKKNTAARKVSRISKNV